MSVKSAIAEVRSRPSTLPAMPPTAAVSIAAQSVPVPEFEVETSPPPDLDEIAARVIDAYARGANPDRRDVNQAPWCLWAGKRPLVREPGILTKFLAHLRASKRKSTFRRLASAYVVRFDLDEARKPRSSLNEIAGALREVAAQFTGPLSDASRHLHLFDPTRAPGIIAELALKRRCSPSKVLADFGIQNLGAEAGLAEAAFLSGLDHVRTDTALSSPDRLEAIRSWGTRADGSVIFDQWRGAYVDALVSPLKDATLEAATMDAYLKFLVAKFNDPRLRPARWQPMTSTPTVLRWLTALSLRQFLDVVDQGAYDFQWRFRRAFWEAVHRHGLIQEAWVIFDEVGDRAARRLFDVKAPYARWAGGGRKQLKRGHAVLIILIGRGVVAEWSHDGVCNIWHDAQDPSAPRLRRGTYTTNDVQIGGRTAPTAHTSQIKHDGSSSYAWQVKLANEIFLLTNVRVMESEYRV